MKKIQKHLYLAKLKSMAGATQLFLSIIKMVHCDYSGTREPILFHKSHLAPLPPSHVYAFVSRMSFINPGPSYCVALAAEDTTRALYGIPPVSFKFSIRYAPGPSVVKTGQSLAAFTLTESFPFASAFEIEGSPSVMKFAHIVVKAS